MAKNSKNINFLEKEGKTKGILSENTLGPA